MQRQDGVGWVLSGHDNVPGARINGLNVHYQFIKTGVRSAIVRQPAGYAEHLLPDEPEQIIARCLAEDIGVLILQKVNGSDALRLVSRAKSFGIRTVFVACDTVDDSLAEACDHVFAVSGYLKGLFSKRVRTRIHVLDDAIEVPERFRTRAIEIPDEGRLRAVFLSSTYPDATIGGILDACAECADITVVSSPPAEPSGTNPLSLVASAPSSLSTRARSSVQQLKEAFDKYGFGVVPRLWRRGWYKIGSRPPRAIGPSAPRRFIEWKLSTVYELLAEHHIGLVPIWLDSDFKMAKSANRLATFMAFGMPTVVSPLPAYVDHLRRKPMGIVARSPEEWRRAICQLNEDRQLARRLGANANEYAWTSFSVEVVARQLWDAINQTPGNPASQSKRAL